MPHVGVPCRVGLIGWWLLTSLAFVERARAEGPAGVDAVLAATDARLTPSGARRVDGRTGATRRMGNALCEEWVREPGAGIGTSCGTRPRSWDGGRWRTFAPMEAAVSRVSWR